MPPLGRIAVTAALIILVGIVVFLTILKPSQKKEQAGKNAYPEKEVNKCSVHVVYLCLTGVSVELFLTLLAVLRVIALRQGEIGANRVHWPRIHRSDSQDPLAVPLIR